MTPHKVQYSTPPNRTLPRSTAIRGSIEGRHKPFEKAGLRTTGIHFWPQALDFSVLVAEGNRICCDHSTPILQYYILYQLPDLLLIWPVYFREIFNLQVISSKGQSILA